MPVITDKNHAQRVIEKFQKNKICMAVFASASHWNTEAILLAASRFARRNNLKKIFLAMCVTSAYPHMQQTYRVTYSRNPIVGYYSIMEHLKYLCEYEYSPYKNVYILPHLDHGQPRKDKWLIEEPNNCLVSVMFDAQKYTFYRNIEITKDFVKKYGKKYLIEGVMDELSVLGNIKNDKIDTEYVDRAKYYFKETGVDFLVADLGTEQQSNSIGKCKYFKERAIKITNVLGKSMLSLHGTSCLNNTQMSSLASNGVIRVNLWTRIAREAGQYAYLKMKEREKLITDGYFEACESRQYIYNSIKKASDIMYKYLDILGYKAFSKVV